MDTEFSKSADEDILAVLKGLFDDFQGRLKQSSRFPFGEAQVVADGIYDVILCEGQDSGSCEEGIQV